MEIQRTGRSMPLSWTSLKRRILGRSDAGERNSAKNPNERWQSLSDQVRDEIFAAVHPFTMTSYERVLAMIDAVEYTVRNRIKGDIVECGVWKGGSIMAAMIALVKLGDRKRRIWLYDTFEGMTAPQRLDLSVRGECAEEIYAQHQQTGSRWCEAALEEVKANLSRCDYPPELVRFVVGPVEQTLKQTLPGRISLLRLDTDWYESTKCELEILYPRLTRSGVLIVDDYGHWAGSKKAVDEFFANAPFRPLFHRIDYSGRLILRG
jgi:O-methyltransferase